MESGSPSGRLLYMGTQERRAREKEELRQQIIAVGRELFATEGFDAVSVRKIAEKIEYSPTTIYLYFEDKADLFDCVVEERMLEFHGNLQSPEFNGPDPYVNLRRGLRAYVEFWIAHPNDFRLSFLTDLRGFDPNREWRCLAVAQKIYDTLRVDLRRCREKGLLEFEDLELTSQMVWSQVFGVMCLQIMKPRFPWVDRDRLIESVIDSALAHAAPVPAA